MTRETAALDLGHGVQIERWITDKAGHRIGLVQSHPGEDGEPCAGPIYFDLPEMRAMWPGIDVLWQVEAWEPLTLSPSLLCVDCGSHGFIRGGRWQPA